jgi:hypothetical protein
MEIAIRKATHQDREALSEIHVSSIRELGKSHYSEVEVDAWSTGRTPARYEGHISERHVDEAHSSSLARFYYALSHLWKGDAAATYHPAQRTFPTRRHTGWMFVNTERPWAQRRDLCALPEDPV